MSNEKKQTFADFIDANPGLVTLFHQAQAAQIRAMGLPDDWKIVDVDWIEVSYFEGLMEAMGADEFVIISSTRKYQANVNTSDWVIARGSVAVSPTGRENAIAYLKSLIALQSDD